MRCFPLNSKASQDGSSIKTHDEKDKTMAKKLYKARELAEILNVHPQTIYRAGQRGEIPTYRVGKSVRFEMPKEGQNNERTYRSVADDTRYGHSRFCEFSDTNGASACRSNSSQKRCG